MVERPCSEKDPHNTFLAIRGFHATHLVWVYGNNRDFVERVHAAGLQYQGALSHSSYAGERASSDWPLPVATVDHHGRYVTPHWMRTWPGPPWWGCVNNPRHLAGHTQAAIAAVEAGADFLQRDEPEGNFVSVRWGACFCRHCMSKFREYLARSLADGQRAALRIGPLESFDYGVYLRSLGAPAGDALWDDFDAPLKKEFTDFQFQATLAFHQAWRTELNRVAGRYVPVACNNNASRWTEIERMFDFFNGELSCRHATPAYLYDTMRKAAEWGGFQVVTMPQKTDCDDLAAWRQLTRRSTATAYAAGGIGRVPWDTFMPGDAPRFFGEPSQYADLFGFVRACARYLDGYEDVCVAAEGVSDWRWADEDPPLIVDENDRGIAMFVRALPGQPTAPVVAHFIDWRDEPRPFHVTINPVAMTGNAPYRVRLAIPSNYDQALHEQAWRTGDYRALREVAALDSGPRIKIPALNPWGILLIDSPAKPLTG